jgi:DNA-binding transcriptional ArsR family regulator
MTFSLNLNRLVDDWAHSATLNHMVDDFGNLDGVFHALANHARREILNRLAEHPLSVGELAEPLTMSLAATSKHIKVLERAGLVEQTVAGRRHLCHLVALLLVPAAEWLQSATEAPALDATPLEKEGSRPHSSSPSPPGETASQGQRARIRAGLVAVEPADH